MPEINFVRIIRLIMVDSVLIPAHTEISNDFAMEVFFQKLGWGEPERAPH